MKYQLVYFARDPDCVKIEINKDLPSSPAGLVNLGMQVVQDSRFLTDLCSIDGVESVGLGRYSIELYRANSMFEFDMILKGVLYVLSDHIESDGDLEVGGAERIIDNGRNSDSTLSQQISMNDDGEEEEF